MTSMENVRLKVKEMSSALGLADETLQACIENEKTHSAIVTQSQFAQNLNITGTPTIYVNGKKLKGGQMLDVLKRAYDISIDK
jgi:protein-disulfide isomerase